MFVDTVQRFSLHGQSYSSRLLGGWRGCGFVAPVLSHGSELSQVLIERNPGGEAISKAGLFMTLPAVASITAVHVLVDASRFQSVIVQHWSAALLLRSSADDPTIFYHFDDDSYSFVIRMKFAPIFVIEGAYLVVPVQEGIG